MIDRYPEHLEFEFDRVALRRYLRAKWFLGWTLPLGGMGALFRGAISMQRIADAGSGEFIPVWAGGLLEAVIGFGVAAMIGAVAYLFISHIEAERHALSQHLKVEGAFLRFIRKGSISVDQKIHFRSIVDYTVIESPFMRRFGIKTLKMTTTSGSTNCFIIVHGVLDCEVVRDQLAEIDSVRECM